MLDLRLLATFAQSARTGSFSAAARALQLTPAAVSQNIKNLERQLGVRLFTRTTRQVRLTPEGQRFLARCAPALTALEDAVRALADEAERIEGRLRISTTTSFGRSRILPLAMAFMDEHPAVAIELDFSDRFVDLVGEGYDLAIRIGNLPENEYVARLLQSATPLLCAAPSYLARHGRPTQISELARHRCIGMRSGGDRRVFPWEFGVDGDVVRLEIEPALTVNEAAAVALAARAGFGLAQTGSFLVEEHIRSGELELLLKDHIPRVRGIYAVYPSRRYTPLRTKAFIDFIAAKLQLATAPQSSAT